jgi:hypothetical protein
MTGKTTNRYKNFNFEAFINAPTVQAFIGKNYQHYKEIWSADYTKYGKPERMVASMHFNLLALLMPPAWFAYRKMWKVLLIWLGAICGLTVVATVSGVDIPGGAWTGVNIVIALMSKGMYFDHVTKFFEANKNLPGPALDRAIERQGGTSAGMAILGTVFSVLVIIAVEIGCYFYTNTTNAVIVDTSIKAG